jgi:enoyl-CoA hydratase/carnithine racemase
MPASLSVAERDDGVRVVTLSNPEKRNALDDGVLEHLFRALEDTTVRAWVFRGEGEVFSAGYDLTTLAAPRPRLVDERLGEVFDRLALHPAPSIALVNGAAVGAGCELAMACDFRVGGERASFTLPPARIGVVYARKGLARVVSRVGEQFARWMFLTGRKVDAAMAREQGLLDVLAKDPEAEAFALAHELAHNAPLAVAGMKVGLSILGSDVRDVDLEHFETLRRRSFASDDAKEGVAAVLDKRAPVFRGR